MQIIFLSSIMAYCQISNKPFTKEVTGEFPAQMASNAENVSIWWRHHANIPCKITFQGMHCPINYIEHIDGNALVKTFWTPLNTDIIMLP